MKHGFRGRLAYIRWLRDIGRVPPESDPEFAKAAGVGYGWLQKWKKRDASPRDRVLAPILSAALGVSEAWLFDGKGEPPEPTLWARWSALEPESANPASGPRVDAPAHQTEPPAEVDVTPPRTIQENAPAKRVAGARRSRGTSHDA